jgi:rifampin ADP-ribosylating transferase
LTTLATSIEPSNITRFYRFREPFRIVGEVADWEDHTTEETADMPQSLEQMKALGIEAIND